LQIAPSGYRRHAALRREPHRRCARVQRDEALAPQIERVWRANMQVYGADKVWRQLAREGTAVARCTVERLMRRQGLRGVRRGKVVRTTISDNKAPCPLDKVNRQFRAERPNQLWVSDFTYVSTWQGWLGEFNQSLQHVLTGGVDEAEEIEIGSIAEAQAAVARQAVGTASRCAMAVLEGDRARTYQRGRSRNCRRGAGCRNSLVPTMRRYASVQSRIIRPRAHRAVPRLR
jgi:transposase InsO family protein